MKYQITCDNCGSKFIVEAQEGSTIECQCPNCKGLMEITLPLVSKGQEYNPQLGQVEGTNNNMNGGGHNNKVLWIIVILLIIIAIALGAYFGLRSNNNSSSADSTAVMDTIPYQTEQPVEPQEPEVVDTVQAAPEEQPEEEAPQEEPQERQNDTTAVSNEAAAAQE